MALVHPEGWRELKAIGAAQREIETLALLADGHLLVEGAPGLAKTTAVKELAARFRAGPAKGAPPADDWTSPLLAISVLPFQDLTVDVLGGRIADHARTNLALGWVILASGVGYALLPIGLVVGLLVTLILLEPDFGTSMSLALIAGVMVFGAGLSYLYVLGAAALAIPAVVLLMFGAAYRRARLTAFMDPWADPQGTGFQLIQSLIAVGTGGITGRGLMQGVQKMFFLPEPHSDFIYAVISEELGLIGATAVLICFCVITWRGLRVASNAPDTFGAFLALGLTTMISVQALVNISVVLGLLPTKGIPLPFVSAGGSSLIINLLGMGVLLNVSRHASSAT